MWLIVTGLIERMLKVALLALTKFGYCSWSIFNSFVLDNDRMLWLLLSCFVVYVCFLLLNVNYGTDWAWHDRTGHDSKRSDGTGPDQIWQDMMGEDATGHKVNSMVWNGIVKDGSVWGCYRWVEFNSSVGFIIFVYVYKVVLFVGNRSKRKVPTPLTLLSVAIKLVSKVLLLKITRLAPVSIHISTLSVSDVKLCGVWWIPVVGLLVAGLLLAELPDAELQNAELHFWYLQ